jgi:hypothetical protein
MFETCAHFVETCARMRIFICAHAEVFIVLTMQHRAWDIREGRPGARGSHGAESPGRGLAGWARGLAGA